jgi:uncharacterized protein YggE
MIDQVKALGVEARDIRTAAVTVTPVYDEERDPSGRVTKRTLRGYLARNSVDVRVRQIDTAGTIARQLIDKGANEFGGITFSISDAEQRMEELRAQALKEAAAKAKTYADALGVKLGRILEIDPDPFSRAGGEADLPARALARGVPDVVIPVEPGVRRLTVQVAVVWAIAE